MSGLDDYIFDISITANRPDCQSVLGIAREVAAILGKPLHMPAMDYKAVCEPDAPITVQVEALTCAPVIWRTTSATSAWANLPAG